MKPKARKISLSPEAMAALQSDEKVVDFSKPLSPKVVRIIRKQIMQNVFGPNMRPTFRQQLLQFVSLGVLATVKQGREWRERTAR